jgi:glutamyl-tRNA synthetase
LRILAPDLQTRARRLSQVCEQVEFLYQGKLELDVALFETGRGTTPPPLEALVAAEAALEALDDSVFAISTIESALETARVRHDWKKGPFYGPIRVALTGKTQTPPNYPMLAALGRERSLARMRDAIALLTQPD